MLMTTKPAGHAAPFRRVCLGVAIATLLLSVCVQQAQTAEFRLLKLQGKFIKWGEPRFQAGTTVSYALLKGDHRDPGAINCKAMISLAGLLGRSGLDLATFAERLKSALSMWQAAADITFVPAASAATADIIIGAQAFPRGIAFTNIEREPVPGSRFVRLGKATICLNPMVA